MTADSDAAAPDFTVRPLSPATWADLEALFGLPGGSIVRGCWCMHYRKTGTPAWTPAQNKAALCDLVSAGVIPGLGGYLDGTPAGWSSRGPRPGHLRLRRSPVMKPVDDTDVWSVVCSYVPRAWRGRGCSTGCWPPRSSSPAAAGPPCSRPTGRQARAHPRPFHVLRVARPVRAGLLHRGHTAIPHPGRDAPDAVTAGARPPPAPPTPTQRRT